MSSISNDRWRELSPLLDRAIEMDGEERDSWLQSLRSGDPQLAADLEDLLDEHKVLSEKSFLEHAVELPPETTLEGQTLGAYTLLSPIGQGGMGSVWLARRSDGRYEGRAAVKFLNASALGGRAGLERFRREGDILARLACPGITRLIDAGVSQMGQPYLVLEHVEGEHIDRYCDTHSLAPEARIRLFLDVLDAVAHAHANLIVHRDIKPSNVLVTPDGQVKLLDFGIAKLLEDTEAPGAATALTREGGWALTPEYAAPEQIMRGAVTTATDVYSSGVLLYQLLGGRRKTGTPAETLSRMDAEFARLSNVPGDLATVVAKALKKNPAERYASAVAFADDLRRYLDHEPISARPDTVGYRLSKLLRRRWKVVTVATALLLLVAALTVFYTLRLAAERNHAQLEAAKAAKVSDLLMGMLTASDPYVTRENKEPTVRSLLDAGAARVHKELAGQPEVMAQMLTVIGRVYQRLGERDKAQPLLEEALAIGRRGPENESLAQSLNDLGVLRREKGDYRGAEPLLTEALTMRRKLLGSEHPDVAVTLVDLARVYTHVGDDKRAEPLLREALQIRRKALGEEHPETATSWNDLALVVWGKGDIAQGAELLKKSLAIYRKTGGDDAKVAGVLGNLGLVTEDLGDLRGAESLLREALALDRKMLDKNHPSIALRLNNLSHPVRVQGRYDEAAELLREALAIADKSLGSEHPNTAHYMANLARVQLLQGQPAAAEPLVRRALEILRRAYRKDDWRTAATESLLGAILTSLGKFDEAERLLLDAQRVIKDIPGSQADEARAARERIAALREARLRATAGR